MTDIERLDDRLTAVERTVIDGDHDFDDLDDLANLADALESIDERLDDFESRLAELEAHSESLQGYVANVDSINEDVAKQAASAVAATESLEERLDAIENRTQNETQYEQITEEDEGETRQFDHDDEVQQTVDDIMGDEDRRPQLGTDPRTNGHATEEPGQAEKNGGSNGADPNEVKARFQENKQNNTNGAESEAPDEESGDESDDDSGGLLSPLKNLLS